MHIMAMQLINRSAKLVFLTGILLVFNQCSRNPVTGKKELSFMSESQEMALGQQADPEIQAEYGVYPDSSLQQYLAERGAAMAKISHRPNLPFQFKVVDSDVVNAFAVPGGYVYFTRGILAHFNSEAQLMGVLGHEIGHVTARHGAQQQTKQMLGQLVLIGGLIAAPEFAQFAEAASQGLQLLMLKYSRDHETQSDKLGVQYATQTGYDAREMAGFFKTIGRIQESAGATLPTFLSTHPDPGDRYTKVLAMASETQQNNPSGNYAVNRESYLRRIDGIVYGEDPHQGYVADGSFFHPVLKFQFPVPSGWKTQNTPQQFQMVSSDQKGMMFLTLAPQKSLSEAANGVLTQFKLRAVDQRNTTVNGLQAIAMISDQVPQAAQGQQPPTPQQVAANTVRVASMLIEYNGLIYAMHGVSKLPDYSSFERLFANTLQGFRPLTDAARINVSPERLRIKTVYNDGTFAEAMRAFNQPEKRMKELAILNGMELTDRVTRGMLIKTIGK
jgi:predicted Zn-dependent protease